MTHIFVLETIVSEIHLLNVATQHKVYSVQHNIRFIQYGLELPYHLLDFTQHRLQQHKSTDRMLTCHHLCPHQLISPWRRMYASVNWVIFGSGNGLSPQPVLPIVNWTVIKKLQWNSNPSQKVLINEFENFVCESAAILSRWDELTWRTAQEKHKVLITEMPVKITHLDSQSYILEVMLWSTRNH